MSNRVSVELGLNVAGYKQGMKDAKDATQQYNTETKKIKDNLGNMRQELGRAKKEVQNLALAYSRLSAEQRKSQFGVEMKRQLDMAKESASELIDLQGDISTELKNMASDTKVLDQMSEGFGVIGNAASGALGAIALFTGEEVDAQRAVVAFTTAQSVLASVTKMQNALQMQSNTMLAVQKVQTLAAAAATNIKTAAEGKGVIVTKAATVAQAAFNAVAYANPYVLLAMAIAGVVAALGAFVVWSNKSKRAQEEENAAKERAKELNDAYYSSLNQELSDTMTSYIKLQTEWKNLKSVGEKNQWIKDNEDKFHDLGVEINNISDAENFFIKNTEAAKEAFMARARAAALAAEAAAAYQQALKNTPKEGDKVGVQKAKDLGLSITNRKLDRHWFSDNEITITAEEERKVREQKMKEAEKQIGKLYDEMSKEEQKHAQKLADAGVKAYNKQREKALKKGSGSKNKKEEYVDPDSLKAAEDALKKLEDKRTKISIDSSELPKLLKDIEEAKRIVESRKIKLGLQVEKSKSDILSDIEKSIQKEFNTAADELVLATITNDIDNIDKLADAYDKAKKKLEDFNATKKLTTEGVEVTGNKNFGDAKSGNFDKSIDGYNQAISTLQEKLSSISFTDGLPDAADLWEELTELVSKYREEVQKLNEIQEEAVQTDDEKKIKNAQKLANRYSKVADAVSTVGDAFSAVAQLAEDDPTLNAMGIVAQAVANVLLGYAQATVAASQTGNPWVWIAFAVAGLATALSAVASIKSAAEAHAQGGIVGGSSYSGDNVLTRLNSGEMVLNKTQQQNLFNAINSNNLGAGGGTQQVLVQGVIRGTDLLLVQKNANKVASKTGTQINF